MKKIQITADSRFRVNKGMTLSFESWEEYCLEEKIEIIEFEESSYICSVIETGKTLLRDKIRYSYICKILTPTQYLEEIDFDLSELFGEEIKIIKNVNYFEFINPKGVMVIQLDGHINYSEAQLNKIEKRFSDKIGCKIVLIP